MILFWLLRNQFKKNNFRNYHEVSQSETWLRNSKLLRIMCATFSEISSLETTFQNSLRANYENFDRIEDRKLAITFKVPNPTHFCWYYNIEKGSRNRSRAVSGWKSMEVTWFLPIFYKIFFQIMFLSKIYGFSKKIFFQNNQKTITNTIQATDFTHILYF